MTTFVIVVTIVVAFVLGAAALVVGGLVVIDRFLRWLQARLEQSIDKGEVKSRSGRRTMAQFVEAWNSSSDSHEVAGKLGISRKSVPTHASRARKAGHKLIEHKNGRPRKAA
jgi:hypothetical protein